MTIIEPNKHKLNLAPSIILLGISLAFSVVFIINLYSRGVDLKHNLVSKNKQLQELQVLNADYKNKLYQVLNSQNINSITKERNLIPEENPRYLEGKWEDLAKN